MLTVRSWQPAWRKRALTWEGRNMSVTPACLGAYCSPQPWCLTVSFSLCHALWLIRGPASGQQLEFPGYSFLFSISYHP